MDETKLIEMLNALADGGKVTVEVRHAVKSHGKVTLDWRDETDRRFAELVSIAARIGDVKALQELRGVKVNGETQYVMDPALLQRFGFPGDDDAAETAAMLGYPQWPFALDVDGNKIPVLSTRFPRPQRPHRQFPATMRDKDRPDFGPFSHVGKAAFAKPKPSPQVVARDEGAPLPPYARRVPKPAAPASAIGDYVAANPKPTIDKSMSPMRADFAARVAALNDPDRITRPIDRNGRATLAAIRSGPHTDDPPERNG